MVLPSRRIPPLKPERSAAAIVVDAVLLLVASIAVVSGGPPAWLLCGTLGACMTFGGLVGQRWVARMRAARGGESICQFARAFGRRRVDSRIVRAVYEHYSRWLGFPPRADDALGRDLCLDPDDIDDQVVAIARRARRSVADTVKNPRCGHVETLRDLVLFLDWQPRC